MFTHQRKQEIINILIQDQKWHTLEELAEYAQCAVKTVRRDLHYLKEHLPSDWRIKLIKGKGVALDKPSHSSYMSILPSFKRENIQFRLLHQLFQGQVNTIAELATLLNVPVSIVSSGLYNMQKYLHYFHLELGKKPLCIVGEEGHIIYMFYELYFTTYGLTEWPFPEEREVFSYISKIERKLSIQFYPSYTQRLAYLLAIVIQRKKQGYEIEILSVYEEFITETPFYHKIKKLPSSLCGVSLTKADQISITIAVNCSQFIYADQNQYKEEVLQHFDERVSTIYQYVSDLVEQLEKEFDMSFRHDEEFLFCLLQYIRQISYRYQFLPTLTSPSAEWHNQVKQKHAITFQKVHSAYTTWVRNYPFLFHATEEDMLAVTMQLEASFQLLQTYHKKVLLYLADPMLWKRYIQSILHHEFGNKLFIIPEEVLDIHKYDLQQLDIDGIISTIPVENMNIPILQISVIPTRRELDDIQAFLWDT